MPGYGDDLVEAGNGPDRIVLNDVYMYQAAGGIGHKHIRGRVMTILSKHRCSRA